MSIDHMSEPQRLAHQEAVAGWYETELRRVEAESAWRPVRWARDAGDLRAEVWVWRGGWWCCVTDQRTGSQLVYRAEETVQAAKAVAERAMGVDRAYDGLLELQLRSRPRPSLHAEALERAGVEGPAMTDRELLVELLRRSTQHDQSPRLPRWARVSLPHGSGVRQALLRAAGLDPDEVTGWDGTGCCPVCGEVSDEQALESP